MGAARDCGLTPGRDIAIVGFNDTPLAAQLPIALSSVHSPMRDMGYRAMELLLKNERETPASLKLEPQLVIRGKFARHASPVIRAYDDGKWRAEMGGGPASYIPAHTSPAAAASFRT